MTKAELGRLIERLARIISTQLSLCCHRDVGNLPTLPRRRPGPTA